MTVPEEQTRRQLFAQYPTQEVLQRSAVMQYFDDTANKEINQMWINVRCYNMDFRWCGHRTCDLYYHTYPDESLPGKEIER